MNEHRIGWSLSAALRSPAVHFVVVGALLYALSGSQETEPAAQVLLEIPAARVELLRNDLHFELGRSPSPTELRAAVDSLIDEEVLIRHALDLGLDREPAVERRLAQIASFVEGDENDMEQGIEADLANRARALGLQRSDRVVRNILIDRASRLIRAAVLVREPTDAALERYLNENAAVFRRPSRWALAHVELREVSASEAEQQLDLLNEAALGPEIVAADLAGWGKSPSVPSVLPALSERDLARRFGHGFAGALAEMPEGVWAGPVSSPYGLHLVRILEHRPGVVPPLDEVRDEVRGRLRHELAERWLDERLRGLRAEYDVRVGPVRMASWKVSKTRKGKASS